MSAPRRSNSCPRPAWRPTATALARGLVLALALGLRAAAAFPGIEVVELDPATTLVVLEDHRAPVVEVRVEFPVGRWSPWAREHHAAEAFAIQLEDSERALLRRADSLAVGLQAWMGARSATVSASCLRDDLPGALELIHDVLQSRDFNEAELKRWRKQQRIGRAAQEKTPEFRRAQAVARLLYAPEDPRRRPYESLERIETRARRLVAVRDTIVRLPGRTVALAGDVTLDEAARLVDGLLPAALDERPRGLAPDLMPLAARPGSAETVVVRLARLTQAYFALARDAPGWLDDDAPAFLVANHVLGGHFFSRLYVALRHEEGETYGASARSTSSIEPGALTLTTFTKAEGAAATEKKLRDVLARFHAGGITEEERAAAAGNLLGRRPFARETPGQVLDRFLTERRLGLPAGFFDRRAERAAALDLEEINEFIGRWYDPRDFSMIRVEPE
jgi:predicted Zn-dependent peptidase